MTLKDFSFAQLDKSAKLTVGKIDKKSDKTGSVVYARCSLNRGCRHFSKK